MNCKLIVCLNNNNFRDFYNNHVPWFNEFILEIYNNFNCYYESNHDDLTDEYFLDKYKKIPNFIISYEIMPKLNNSSKKILITEDLHNLSENTSIEYFNNSDIILSRFNLIPYIFGTNFKSKIVDYPLYCSNSFLNTDVNLNSINKIFFYGSIQTDNYIYRKEWYTYFVNNYNENFVYCNDTVTDTIKNMSQYTIGFTCTYINSYIKNKCDKSYFIAKFFEIPGAGLLLLADISYVEDFIKIYGFIDGENFISINKQNADSVINYILNPNNKDIINKIRINGYNLIKKNHLINNRINLLKRIIENN